jgi:hypothetical protein
MPTSFDPAKQNQQPSFESDISGQRLEQAFLKKWTHWQQDSP